MGAADHLVASSTGYQSFTVGLNALREALKRRDWKKCEELRLQTSAGLESYMDGLIAAGKIVEAEERGG